MPESHKALVVPAERDASLWRYLSVAKLLDLALNKRLMFARVDSLDDGFEGVITEPMTRSLREFSEAKRVASGVDPALAAKAARQLPAALCSDVRRMIFVNSWSLAPAESHALWRIFCGGDDGVAIRSTVGKIHGIAASSPDVYLAQIVYIDYEADAFSLDNVFRQVVHKRREFEYEREVRLVWAPWSHDVERLRSLPLVMPLDVDPVQVVEEIVVGPYAMSGLETTVGRLLEVAGVNVPVRRSRLSARSIVYRPE